MKQAAPILLFTYKRLITLKSTVSALQRNIGSEDSELFIFSDAAKNVADEPIVKQIRQYIREIDGFKKVTIIEASKNKGLASSIIDGVTTVLESFDSAIILEDDLSTTPNFLLFMNNCLEAYKDKGDVFSISGYSFNLGYEPGSREDAYLLNRGWSWGWATWRDRWNKVDWSVGDYSQFIKDPKARKAFARGGSDLNKMLDKQMSGNLDSWAIRWFYHQFRIKGLTIYPVRSKVFNNGFDQDATHTNGSARRYLPLLDEEGKKSFVLPEKIEISRFYQNRFNQKMGILSRIRSKIETLVLKFFR